MARDSWSFVLARDVWCEGVHPWVTALVVCICLLGQTTERAKLTDLPATRNFVPHSCALCSVGLFDYLMEDITVDYGLQSSTVRLRRGIYYFLAI